MKRLIIVAAAVAVLALAAVAIGGAVTSAQEDNGPLGSFLAKVADKLGVSEDELNTAIDEARTETIDEAVAEGRLTEEQGERLKERAEEGGFPFPWGPRHGGPHLGWHPGLMADAAAEALGMTKDELVEALKDGNSLAEVAGAQGMSVEDFKVALLAQVQAQLDEQVAAGDLTQEQADETFQRIEENIDSIVNGEGCLGGFGGMRHGPRGFGGPWGEPSDDEPESTETSDVTA